MFALRLCFVALILSSPLGVHAFSVGKSAPVVTKTNGGASIDYVGSASGQIATERLFTSSSSGVTVSDKVFYASSVGNVALTVETGITGKDLAMSALTLLPGIGTAVGLLSFGADIYSWLANKRISPATGGGFVVDAGVPQNQTKSWWVNCQFAGGAPMQKGECLSIGWSQCNNPTWSPADVSACKTVKNQAVEDMYQFEKVGDSGVCPQIPSWWDAGGQGIAQPGEGGKCPGGQLDIVTVEAASDSLASSFDQMTAQAKEGIAKTLTGKADGVKADPSASSLKGPGSVTGKPKITTTTGPEGTTTTVETPSAKLTYGKDEKGNPKVEENKTTTQDKQFVSSTDPAKNTTTTSTTEEAKPETEVPDFCLDFPDRLGCVPIGTAPEAVPLQKKVVQVAAPSADSRWNSLSGGSDQCPSKSFTVHGMTIPMDYSLLCQGFAAMRPVVLGVATLLSGWFFAGFRRGDES